MRLLDQVAQARGPLLIEDAAGLHVMEGAADLADEVRATPLRYVMDGSATTCCLHLISTDHDMLTGENTLLRVPARSFWLEWPGATVGNQIRTGVLVSATADGRCGRVRTFWEQAEGEPDLAQLTTDFDLDRCIGSHSDGASTFALSPGSHPLAPHLLFRLEDRWRAHLLRADRAEVAGALDRIGGDVLASVEMLLGLSVLLNERGTFDRKPVDLARLNRQRSRRGRPDLLDHVEVSVRLPNERAVRDGGLADGADRRASRLHYVRGHMVTREGASFWRRSHLRGDTAATPLTRTVRLTAR